MRIKHHYPIDMGSNSSPRCVPYRARIRPIRMVRPSIYDAGNTTTYMRIRQARHSGSARRQQSSITMTRAMCFADAIPKWDA